MLGAAWKKAPRTVGAALPAAQRQHAVKPSAEILAHTSGKSSLGSR